MLPGPELTTRSENGHDVPLLVWRLPAPVRAISSAVLGGGLGPCQWLINATVPMSYDRDGFIDAFSNVSKFESEGLPVETYYFTSMA